MYPASDQAVYRCRRFYRKGDRPKKYAGTYEISDDRTQEVMAVCDLIGKAVFSALRIMDDRQNLWQMTPNRSIMPSRWVVAAPDHQVAMQFDQKILGKLVNPLYKVVLSLHDGQGNEVYRLVDPRTSIPDQIFGAGPNDWALMAGDKAVARLVRLPRQQNSGKGLFGKLRNLLTASDRGMVSAGRQHLLPAPVALGMFLLFEEVSDTSAE